MNRRGGLAWLVGVAAAAAAGGALAAGDGPAGGRLWHAGPYSFSDELGGFAIVGVRGTGTRADPFLIRQELFSSSPVTLVIRATTETRPFDASGLFANGQMHLRVEVLNNSGQAWQEFEFELQEEYRRPSVYGDGLSFDQRREGVAAISSDRFGAFSRDFEPFDRLRFREGFVDPLQRAGFSFFITDFTPRAEFYLLEDPRIPAS